MVATSGDAIALGGAVIGTAPAHRLVDHPSVVVGHVSAAIADDRALEAIDEHINTIISTSINHHPETRNHPETTPEPPSRPSQRTPNTHTHNHATHERTQSGTGSAARRRTAMPGPAPGGGVVLNIGRVGPGGENYYLKQVVAGAEDYYVERGEEPGVWIGDATRTLNLHGRVEADDLKAVLEGRDPRSGDKLAEHPARKVAGFDLAFRAPKSVSLAWGLTDDADVATQVKQAHESAVAAAIKYLEREAGWTRRGAGGAEKLPGCGLVGAAFNHRTSRAGDPLLHTHVLVANQIQTADDGVWRTLDSRRMYRHAKTAGFLYQAELRHQLTERLGLEWQPVVNGHADLEGFDREIIEAFSQRRAAIVARLDELGMDSPAAAQVATLTTRPAKELTAAEAELRAEWRARARQLGFDPAKIDQLLHQVEPDRFELRVDLEALGQVVAGDDGLTAQVATFARRDAVRAVAAALPAGGTVDEIEALADRLLEDGRLVAVGSAPEQLSLLHRTPTDDDGDGEVRFTTRTLLNVETRAIDGAIARRDDGVATVNPNGVQLLVRRHRNLGPDQAAMVQRLTTSGAGVEVVVGKAGSGKTHALALAHEAWTIAGVPVVGCSLAARATRGLQDVSGIPSTTLHRLLAACDDPAPGSPLPPGGVVVVDEAGMVGTRQLARLLAHAEAQRTKVVLVGDPAQLPEIDAGGLFRGLCNRLDTIELTDNRRQQTPWEAAVVDRLRDGHTRAAVDGYAEHGRLTLTRPDDLHAKVLDDWQELMAQHGADRVVIIARTRKQVARLNAAARDRMVAAGQVAGPQLAPASGRVGFAAGDRVVCLRNDRTLDVDNGTRATVVAVDTGRLELTIRPDGRDQHIVLPGAYLADGHLAHGYAITGHKAQGLTVDHALVVADESIDGDWGYVAMSRGRHTNRLYVADHTVERTAHGRDPVDVDPADQLAGRLTRTRADTPLTSRDVYDPVETARRWQQLTAQWLPARKADIEHDRLRTALASEQQSLEHIDGQIELDTRKLQEACTGLSKVTVAGRRQRRRLRQQLDEAADARAEVQRRIVDAHRQLQAFGDPPDVDALEAERKRLAQMLDAVAAQQARQAERHPPAYLTDALGHPPDQPEARAVWRATATRIEAFRARWLVDDPHHALGPPNDGTAQQQSFRRSVEWDIRRAARDIHDLEHPDRQRGISRSLRRAISR